MFKSIKIIKKIKPFNKTINIDGDKSLSIRWALLASQANGKSRAYKLLKSEDVLHTLNCLKKHQDYINNNLSEMNKLFSVKSEFLIGVDDDDTSTEQVGSEES